MTLIPNDYQKGINEAFEISRKEIAGVLKYFSEEALTYQFISNFKL